MTDVPTPSSPTPKKRDINAAVEIAMARYRLESDAVTAKSARLRALREARDAEKKPQVKTKAR